MTLRLFVLLVLLISAAVALAETDPSDGYNGYTIRPSDIPADAPRMTDYPAPPFVGKNATLKLNSDAETRMFRTRIAQWAKEKPNFAGHYVFATWACGTDCTQITIIDAQNGRVYHPPGVSTNDSVNVHEALVGQTLLFQRDSRLLRLIGMPEERSEERGVSYYLWEHNRLHRIRFVRMGWYLQGGIVPKDMLLRSELNDRNQP
jgi:hypothetical protein